MQSLENGYRAIVLGASGGIGGALLSHFEADPRCAFALPLSRSVDGLDITNETTVREVAARLEAQRGSFDLIFNATGALTVDGAGPEKSIRAIDEVHMARQFAVNAIGPALLLKYLTPLLRRDRRTIFASLSARVGSIGDNRLGGMDLLQGVQGRSKSDHPNRSHRNRPHKPTGHHRGASSRNSRNRAVPAIFEGQRLVHPAAVCRAPDGNNRWSHTGTNRAVFCL